MQTYSEVKKKFLQNLIDHCNQNQISVSFIANELQKDEKNLAKIFQGSRDYYSEELIFEMARVAKASPYQIFTLDNRIS